MIPQCRLLSINAMFQDYGLDSRPCLSITISPQGSPPTDLISSPCVTSHQLASGYHNIMVSGPVSSHINTCHPQLISSSYILCCSHQSPYSLFIQRHLSNSLPLPTNTTKAYIPSIDVVTPGAGLTPAPPMFRILRRV